MLRYSLAGAVLGFLHGNSGSRDAERGKGVGRGAHRIVGFGDGVMPIHSKFLIIINENDALLCIIICFYSFIMTVTGETAASPPSLNPPLFPYGIQFNIARSTLWGIKTHQNVFRHNFRKSRRILNKFGR